MKNQIKLRGLTSHIRDFIMYTVQSEIQNSYLLVQFSADFIPEYWYTVPFRIAIYFVDIVYENEKKHL